MKRFLFLLSLSGLLSLAAMSSAAEPLALRYDQSAVRWTEALPVGNGRLGAMVFGGLSTELLQLNESSLWSGAPKDWNNLGAKAALPAVRAALAAGDFAEATAVSKCMQGPFGLPATRPSASDVRWGLFVATGFQLSA